MKFAEGDLEMDIPDVVDGRKFDGDGHGLNRCMKAVDFVVELADRYLFIEFKDRACVWGLQPRIVEP